MKLLGVAALAAGLVALSACGGGSGGSGGGGCTVGGTGTLAVVVGGLPTGVNAAIIVSGSGSTQNLTASQNLSLAGGNYTVSANKTTQSDPIVRTAFSPMVSPSSACVKNGQTVTVNVTYTVIASSGKVWTGNGQQNLGFASSLLGSSGSPGASVVAGTTGSKGLTFDLDGNLWAIGGTTVDPTLSRYPASSLGASGAKTADITLNVGGFSCSPGASALAFDSSGNLWVAIACANKVVRLTSSNLATSGSITPGVEISGLNAPSSLAFDSAGNLWVANSGVSRVVKYASSRLAVSTSAAPDVSIESKTPAPSINTLGVDHLAFDSASNLWVVAFAANGIYRLTATDQSGSGNKSLTPAIQVSISVSGLLEGIAFDEGGGLWVAGSAGQFLRLGSGQLTTSSTAGSPTVPERIFTSSDVSNAGDFALYPAPAGLPLYHRLP